MGSTTDDGNARALLTAERSALTPIELTIRRVSQIHEVGGTVRGSSRGPQPVDEMVDTLERLGIQLLFTIGGDGTLRGAHSVVEEHSHPHEQMGLMLEGEAEFIVGGQRRTVRAGQMWRIPGGVLHKATAERNVSAA